MRLAGWTSKRKVIIVRRPLSEQQLAAKKKTRRSARSQQRELDLGWEKEDILTLAQHYRDRGHAENNFDELKNQWG